MTGEENDSDFDPDLKKKTVWQKICQIFEKFKSVNDEYISSAMNSEDIENASEMYFKQHSRVITTSASI